MSGSEKRVWAVSALVSLAYSVIIYRQLFPHFSSTMVGFGSGDPNQAAWFLANTAHAIESLSNPFVSYQINYPDGANMMANTSTIAVGALFAPITLAFGPIVSLNLVFITGVAATTWSFSYVARKFGLSLASSLIVGVLIGLAPIRIIHGQGQPFYIFAVGAPWLLYSVWKLIEGRASNAAAIAQGVFWLLWSALVSLERLFVLSIPIVVYAALRMWNLRTTDAFRPRLNTLARFALTSALALALPLYEFGFGTQSLHGPPHDWLLKYSAHIRDFVAAGSWMLWRGIGLSGHTTGFLSGNFVNESYIGIPILLVFGVGVWRMRRSFPVRCLALATVVSLILSCGPSISWTGDSWSIPSAYAVLHHLPGFNSAHPVNFQMVSSIAMAFVIGLLVDDYLESANARRWVVGFLALVLVLSILPNQTFATTKVAVRNWFSSTEGRAVIPTGSVVLTYPYPQNIINAPMLDQAQAGMRYKLIGGQATVPNSQGHGQSVQPLEPYGLFDLFANAYLGDELLSLYNVPVGPMPPRSPATSEMLREFVRVNEVDVIVMDYGGVNPVAVVQRLNDAFGEGQVRPKDNLIWWKIR